VLNDLFETSVFVVPSVNHVLVIVLAASSMLYRMFNSIVVKFQDFVLYFLLLHVPALQFQSAASCICQSLSRENSVLVLALTGFVFLGTRWFKYDRDKL
jgi:hypothetical protein